MHRLQTSASILAEMHPSAAAGLKSLASLQSTRQLDERTAASLALTWQPGLGAGLQLHSTRQLTERVNGARCRHSLQADTVAGHRCGIWLRRKCIVVTRPYQGHRTFPGRVR